MSIRKTDYGTVILHGLLVGASVVEFLSGLRIATESPGRRWINLLDPVLPRGSVWVPHLQAAVVLIAGAIAYAIYVTRSGLSRRVQLDKVRMHGLRGGRRASLGSVNVLLTWGFFIAMAVLIASGGMLYFGLFAGYATATVHWYATWMIAAFAAAHILVHGKIGGASQLIRIFLPQRLPSPPARLDAMELLAMLVAQSERTTPGPQSNSEAPPHPMVISRSANRKSANQPATDAAASFRSQARRTPRTRNATLQSNPFVVAAAIALSGASVFVATDWFVVDTLKIHRIAEVDAPILDGDTSDPVWRNIRPLSLMTNHGGNFDGIGESRIDVRAVHDGTRAYFLFTWEDPTRSLKQLPLIKQVSGWHLLHNGYEQGDEHDFNEDKFSVLLTTLDVDLAGDRTFHASPNPLRYAPGSMTGRGLHYTTAAGLYADVWQWKATSGGPTGWMDDDHFGPPLDPTPMQVRNVVPYRAGFAPDPGGANYYQNFVLLPDTATGDGGDQVVVPRRLPKKLADTATAMGQITLDPEVGESDGARWFMTEAETLPYTSDLDQTIPVGTVVPGVIIAGDFSGDRADVRCAARWASGHWALEVTRRLDTHSQYDVPLASGTYMRLAAFDHSQIRHTRHVRPIRLEVE